MSPASYRSSMERDDESSASAALMWHLREEQRRKARLTLVLVEGPDDVNWYGMLLDSERCAIQSCQGRDRVLHLVGILLGRIPHGILGIIDQDFSGLAGDLVAKPNVVITDSHDIGTMIVASPALEKCLYGLVPGYIHPRIKEI
jgi:hypothetical protein